MSIKSVIASMSKKVKIIICCCAAAVVAAAVVLGLLMNREDTYRVLKVFEMSGSAVISREGLGELDAYVGMNLENGDTVSVGEDSTMRIVMDNDKYVLLDSGTVLSLSAAGNAFDSRTKIDLKEGTILNEITKPLSANSSYEVTTPKATMAVRGTSFMVTVEKNPDGSYNIYVNTFEGKVEVTLLDENGDPTDQKAFAEEGRGVTVVTEPNAGSGKPAEIDGISRFVYEDENGTLTELNAGDDPVHDIRYGLVPQAVKQRALLSHDEKLMVLRLDIAKLLRGGEEETEESASGTVGTSADGAVSSDVISSAEEEVSAVTAPPVDVAGDNGSVQTSAPIIEDQNVTVPAMVTVNNEDTGTYISDSDETVISDGRRTESSAKTSGSSVSDSNDETTDGSADGTVVTSVPDEYITEPGSVESGTTVPSPVTTHTSSYTAPYTSPRYTVPTHTTPTSPFIESSATTVSTSSPTEDEKVYYQVRFICEGNIIASETVEKNGTVSSIPAVPDKTGYNGSWHIGDNEFTADTIITADTNVTASYSLKILTVTFKADADETFTQTVTVGYGNSLKDSLPAIPVKTGYVGKWYWNNAEFDGTTVVTANIIVEAVYTPGRCTVTITAADADTPYSETVTADSGTLLSDILLTVPTKTGYDGEWKINGTQSVAADTKVTSDITVKAVYTIQTFTVTITADADTPYSNVITVDYGTNLLGALPDMPQKTGYTGVWKINGTDAIAANKTVTSDITVSAEYTIKTFTVNFTADADTAYSDNKTVGYGTLLSDILPTVPTKTGYDGEWKINGTKSVAEDTKVTSDITVKAVYTIQTFTVTITADADTAYSDSKTVGYGTLLSDILPTVPTKTGYNGVWLIGGTEAVTDSAKVTSDITVEAVYTIQTFTVTITADADTPYSNVITVDYGTNLLGALPDMPKKTGFKGVWKINGTETIAANKTVTSDISVSAEYTVEEFTVTVKADSDTPYFEKFTVEYGTYLSDILPEVVPTKTGYDGVWLIGGTEAVTDSAKVTSDMTVMAVYTIKTFTVTITADADTAYSDSRTVDYGTLLSDILPTVPTKTGHTGVWKINGTEAVANNTEVKSDMTVTAVYTINEYTVTFVADGKTVSTAKVKYNTSVKEYVPAVPEKAGYDGMWVLGDSDFEPTMLITEDITVTAHYQAVTYTVSYFASYDMATVLHTDSVGYGEVPPAYTPDTIVDSDGNGYYDYYLWGWESVSERSKAVTADTVIIVPYEDYDSINELRIKDGSTVLEHRLFKQGETITMPSPVSTPAEGYEFKGWGQVGSGGSYATGLKEGTTYIHETSDSEAETMMSWYEPVSSGSTVTLYYSGNIEFRAVYKPIELTVTMIADGDTPYTNTLTVDYGTAISDILPADVPTKAGYTGKWTLNGSDIDLSMKITSNITIIAEYTQNETDVDVGDPPDEPSEYMTETADLYIKQDQQDTPIEETE